MYATIGSKSPAIEVSILSAEQRGDSGPLRLLLGAEVELAGTPDLDENRGLMIPVELRQRAEELLEHNVNLIAVRLGCKRRLASPSPCIALMSQSAEDDRLLSQATNVTGGPVSFVSARDREPLPSDVMDRLDGVALMAEALSAGTALGELHELVRVFERAFALAGEALVVPLSEFLGGSSGLGYTHKEVRNFLKDIRDPATHADRKEEYFLESQVRPVIARTRQAAYDVLFNKEEWRESSTHRRDLWVPKAGLASPEIPFVRRGYDSQLEFMALDQFGVYPLDMSTGHDEVPDGWWRPPSPAEISAGPLELR